MDAELAHILFAFAIGAIFGAATYALIVIPLANWLNAWLEEYERERQSEWKRRTREEATTDANRRRGRHVHSHPGPARVPRRPGVR